MTERNETVAYAAQETKTRVAAVLGPTAVGKSAMAVEIALAMGAEIVSVDSMQVYRGMDIGTAKPSQELRSMVPHHLIDLVDPSEDFSVSRFQTEARRAVEDIASRGRLPLLVGGTGLYFEAVVFDMRFPPGSCDDGLRKKIERWAEEDPEGLRKSLREVDPAFARREEYVNMRRVVRAMEVYWRTGQPMSCFQSRRGTQAPYFHFAGVVVDAPRQALYRAIEKRVDEMMEAGLLEEVRALLASGRLSRTARQALGYKEILDHLDRGTPLEQTISEIKRRSRRYAKRQLTWFRRVPGLSWLTLSERELLAKGPEAWPRVRVLLERELSRVG